VNKKPSAYSLGQSIQEFAKRDDRRGFPCKRGVYRHIPYAESLGYSLKVLARVDPSVMMGCEPPRRAPSECM